MPSCKNTHAGTVELGYMGLRYVGHLSIWDSFPWYGETSFALHKPWLCGTPGYVGQLGWALSVGIESPTYPDLTVVYATRETTVPKVLVIICN